MYLFRLSLYIKEGIGPIVQITSTDYAGTYKKPFY